MLWSNQVTILHMPRQLSCRGMCKIVAWLDNYLPRKSTTLRIFARFLSWAHDCLVRWDRGKKTTQPSCRGLRQNFKLIQFIFLHYSNTVFFSNICTVSSWTICEMVRTERKQASVYPQSKHGWPHTRCVYIGVSHWPCVILKFTSHFTPEKIIIKPSRAQSK